MCSEWCMEKWQEAVEAGDVTAQNDYMQLYQMWKEREGLST